MKSKRPAFRALQQNKGTEVPSNLIFVDTETTFATDEKTGVRQDHKFRLGVAKYMRIEKGKRTREATLRFTKIPEFWAWAEAFQAKRKTLWIFAHNLPFDFQILRFWEQFEKGDYTAGPVPPDDPSGRVRGKRPWKGRICWGDSPNFLYLMGRTARVNFVDSYNYFRGSLATFGEIVETPKFPMPDFAESDATWFEYCERDVEVLATLITATLENWRSMDAGVWQPTAPGLSLQSFRHQELADKGKRKPKSILLSDDPDASALERESYYGGYFGAFYHGQIFAHDDPAPFTRIPGTKELVRRPSGPVFQVDANGLYPFVMASNWFPFKRLKRADGISPRELFHKFPASTATARVLISSTNHEYPVRDKEHLLYKCGRFWTVLCGPELKRALANDNVQEVRECVLYATSKLFGRWVRFWFAERTKARESGDKMRECFVKLILNSLYGKFAQKGGGWRNASNVISQGRWQHWFESRDTGRFDESTGQPVFTQHMMRDLGGQVQEREEGSDPAHAFPAISAHVSAYAREYMRDVRSKLPEKCCFYQGSDSLILNGRAMNALDEIGLIDPFELGKFNVDGWHEEGEIVAANHYRIGKKKVRSGSWGIGRQRIDGSWYAEIWEGAASFTARAPDGVVRVSQQELRRYDPFPKGEIGEDGWIKWLIQDDYELREQL